MDDLLYHYLRVQEDEPDFVVHDVIQAVEFAIECEDILPRLQEGDHSAAADLLDLADGADERRRKIAPAGRLLLDFTDLLTAIANEAEDLMRAGLFEEAARRVTLLTMPKWTSRTDCDKAYAEAMAARSPMHATQAACMGLPLFAPQPEA
jgi:hypothetical protein